MDSLQREFDAAWTQFQSLEALRLVPETLESEWTRGRDAYLAFLVPVDDPAAVEYLRAAVQGMARIPGVEPYPESYWHITVKGIGFEAETPGRPDDVSRRDFDHIALAARRVFEAQPRFEVTLGPANGFPEVVFAEVRGSVPVRELNTRLLEALPDLIRYPFDGAVFLPHVSVARFTSDDGLDELKATLSSLRGDQAGPSVLISEVQLVRAHLSATAPTLETIETYALRPA
jgi:2'-5' RNA ligase